MRRTGFAAELEAVVAEAQFVVAAFDSGRSADSAVDFRKTVGDFAAGNGRLSAVARAARRMTDWLQ